TCGMSIDYCIMKEGMSTLRGRKSVPGISSSERENGKKEIPSGEIKVHIEVLSVLWGNRLQIRMVRCRCLGKDYAQTVKNQSKPDNVEHKIGSLQQKPNQRAFFSSNQAIKPKCQKIRSSRSILANYPKSKSMKKENQSARAEITKSVKL
nr:hypothetical protein [Tanacetum cinerariifolium]